MIVCWFAVPSIPISSGAVIAMLLFAPVALSLAILNRVEADKGHDVNAAVELTRGAFFGVAASSPLWLTG